MDGGKHETVVDATAELLKKLQLNAAALGTETRQQTDAALQDHYAKLKQLEMAMAMKIRIRESTSLDLLFLLDVTVSMKPYRDSVVKAIGKILTYLESMFKYSKNNVRVGIVGYRDLQLTPRFELKPFTSVAAGGEECIQEWLKRLEFKTSTSNDHPEDVHGGLEKAASDELGGWKSAARTIIHIADAPGHGTRLAPPDAWWGKRGDYHPDFDADGSALTALLRKLRVDLQVQTYKFIHVVDPARKVPDTTAMLQEFRKACGDPAWITEVEWQGDEELALEVVAAASESIQQSVSAHVGVRLAPPERDYKLDATEPDWSAVQALRAKTWAHDTTSLNSIATLVSLIRKGSHIRILETSTGDERLRIAPHPFAKGKHRLAYYGRYYPNGLQGEVREVVIKEFLAADGASNAAVAYKAQLETQTVASFLAGEFNRQVAEAAGSLKVPEVVYAPCELVSVMVGPGLVRFLLMEPLILGTMCKWNNNNGSIDLSDPQPHLQAFSHWTYEVSDKTLMVVDLQGFRTLDRKGAVDIVLNDPAIHCVQPSFYGATNMGCAGGFEAFLHSHMHPTFADLGGHGAICEALIPGCKYFRNSVASRPSAAEGSSAAQSLWGGGGKSAQAAQAAKAAKLDSVVLPSSLSTASTINFRMDVMKKALKGHDLCRRYLRKAGVAVPANMNDAINLCVDKGLVQPPLAKELHERRVAANKARHRWD